MKNLFTLFIALAFTLSARAELSVTTNATFARFASSYFTSHRAGDYLDSAKYLYWSKLNIHCYEDSRGGAGIQEANEARLERKGLAQWANGSQFWGEIWADDNGGYTTNQVVQHATNTFNAPSLLFNGTAYTNEGGWAASHSINWIGVGAIPYTNQVVIGCSEDIRNNAMTNAAKQFAYMAIDMFHPLYIAWSNDIAGPNNVRFGTPDLTHPGPPGNLDMAIVAGQAMMDTNINTAILDFGSGTESSTNHCVVSSASVSGRTLTFSWLADRHSMAWDEPDGTITNNATDGLTIVPGFTNAFFEVITITNAPIGGFSIIEDGSNILSGISTGRIDLNLFSLCKGAVWAQRKEVLGRIRDKRGCDRIGLVDDGSLGETSYNGVSQTQWDLGKRGDVLVTAVASSIANLNTKDSLIWSAATPTNHLFQFVFANPATHMRVNFR